MKKVSVPRFLLKKDFLFETIVFVVAFSALFLVFYRPYSETFWFSLREPSRIWPSLIYGVLSICVLALSKGVMLAVQRTHEMLAGRFYVVTVILEWLTLSAIYVLFSVFYVQPHCSLSLLLCLKALFCIASILAIPYTICFLYAAYRDKAEELAAMKANVASNEITTQFAELEPDFIEFRDYNGVLKLTVDFDSIYYIESQDNYVNICYSIDGQMASYLLRCKTKHVEELLSDRNMIRCHRSYIVNPSHIKDVQPASAGRAKIVLDNEKATEIPVSKTYRDVLPSISSVSATVKRRMD